MTSHWRLPQGPLRPAIQACSHLDESSCRSNAQCEFVFDANAEVGACVPRPANIVRHIDNGRIDEVAKTLSIVSGIKLREVRDLFR